MMVRSDEFEDRNSFFDEESLFLVVHGVCEGNQGEKKV